MRPIILKPSVCYKLYQQTKSLIGVRDLLFKAGVISPYREDGLFTVEAIANAIVKHDPRLAPILTVNPRARQAMAAMQKLEASLK